MYIVRALIAALVARMPSILRGDASTLEKVETFQNFTTVLNPNTTAPELQLCGNEFYDPLKYKCFDNDLLCPYMNGFPMNRCGNGCYLPYEYACSDGNLAELAPMDKPFEIIGVNWLNVAAAKIQACDYKFYMKDGGPCTFCPGVVGDHCPPGVDTVLTRPYSMYTLVPGGQRYYIEPKTGALQYTVPHSGDIPAGAILGVDAKENGVFKVLGTDGWMACPLSINETITPNGNTTMRNWQIFAQLPGLTFAENCLLINILVTAWEQNLTAAAWEYV